MTRKAQVGQVLAAFHHYCRQVFGDHQPHYVSVLLELRIALRTLSLNSQYVEQSLVHIN